jgi:hypothetical protein
VLLVPCLADETLPGETLARNVAILRSVASTRKNVELRELANHDHRGIVPGARHPSPEFMRTIVEWLTRESQVVR